MALRLASVNLHCGLDRLGAPFPAKEAIAGLDADVVLVQENWGATGSGSLAAAAAADNGYPSFTELSMISDVELAALEVIGGSAPALRERGAWGLAVMSRVPWLRTSTIGIGAAPGDVVGARVAQVVEFPGVRLVNVHLTHRLLHGPAQLRRLLRGLAADPMPTVIAGDLNMCRPTVHLARPYRTAVRGRTWPSHRPLAQLDHFLISPDVTVTDARVAPDAGSDHLPIQATVHTL